MSLQWTIGRIFGVVLLLLLVALGKKRDEGVNQDEAGRILLFFQTSLH
jgi:hypothetical protein